MASAAPSLRSWGALFLSGALLAAAPSGCKRSAGAAAGTLSSVASSAASGDALGKGDSVGAGGHPLADYIEMSVAGVTSTAHGSVVLLVDGERRQAVPIFIGDAEALSIRLRLEHQSFERPLTHDLFDAALERLGGEVKSIRIEQLESQTFFATVVLVRGAERVELDARSSDAIALALGSDAPILVAKSVVEEAGIDPDRLHQLLEPGERPRDMPAVPEGGEPVAL